MWAALLPLGVGWGGGERSLGPEARQADSGLRLLGDLVYLLALPYSHDSESGGMGGDQG